jgi:hypothetical protein
MEGMLGYAIVTTKWEPGLCQARRQNYDLAACFYQFGDSKAAQQRGEQQLRHVYVGKHTY